MSHLLLVRNIFLPFFEVFLQILKNKLNYFFKELILCLQYEYKKWQ